MRCRLLGGPRSGDLLDIAADPAEGLPTVIVVPGEHGWAQAPTFARYRLAVDEPLVPPNYPEDAHYRYHEIVATAAVT